MQAALAEGVRKSNRFGFLLALIETESFPGFQNIDIWLQVSHFPIEVLSAYRLA
jgi:hypothetical protein